MKKLILSTSCNYNWDNIKLWNTSAKNTGSDVCNILINPSEDLLNGCKNNKINAVTYTPNKFDTTPYHLRFLLQYKYLMSVKDQYSHVIVTDSRDVYFHHDPFPKLLEIMKKTKKDIVCGSECILYKDEGWNNKNLQTGFGYLYEEIKNNEVCCVGVLGGKTQAVADLCLMIYMLSLNNPAGIVDQISLNVLLATEFGKEKIAITRPSEGLIVHLHVMRSKSDYVDKITEKPSWDEDLVPTVNNIPIPIIHQYDRLDPSVWSKYCK